MRKILNNTIILFSITFLAACGFKLRGVVDLPPQLATMQLSMNNPYSQLRLALEREMIDSGIRLADHAPVTLQITNDVFSRQDQTIGTNSQLQSYQLTYIVDFRLLDSTGQPIIPDQSVSEYRYFTVNPNEILGSESEESILRQELTRAISELLLARLGGEIIYQAIEEYDYPEGNG